MYYNTSMTINTAPASPKGPEDSLTPKEAYTEHQGALFEKTEELINEARNRYGYDDEPFPIPENLLYDGHTVIVETKFDGFDRLEPDKNLAETIATATKKTTIVVNEVKEADPQLNRKTGQISAVIISPNGAETIIRKASPEEGGMIIMLNDNLPNGRIVLEEQN